MTEREIYEKIEEVLASYGGKKLDILCGPKHLSHEEMFELRGMTRACKELAQSLRNALGYNVEDF